MEEEITLLELLSILKKKSKLVLFFSLVGIFISALCTFFLITPLYEASSRIVVNQTQNTNQNITNTDIQTNLNLINTYQSIIKEPIILENVIKNTDVDLTIQELRNKISVQTEANSLVFGINVTDENPYIASDLANAISISFEEKIGEILDVQSVTIISTAVPNLNAVSPNTTLNVILGFFIGFLIGMVISVVTEFFDRRIKDTKIIEDLGWTNLGSVLEMSTNEINETRIDNIIKIVNSPNRTTRRRV